MNCELLETEKIIQSMAMQRYFNSDSNIVNEKKTLQANSQPPYNKFIANGKKYGSMCACKGADECYSPAKSYSLMGLESGAKTEVC